MKPQQYLALLRGINVGGKNVIPMRELKFLFEQCGFSDVQTYIQSGNVIFSSSLNKASKIESIIEDSLKNHTGSEIPVVLLSTRQLCNIIETAPGWFGAETQLFKYDVAFLHSQIDSKLLLPKIALRHGVDRAEAGEGVLYFSKLIEKATQSLLPKLISLPEYRSMTIRNRNTVMRLNELVSIE